ncbi:Si-specific NAD(P)(+) transhydrogenase [Rubellicoccus peritrichatus]|uniref:Soluble pyridine nucleotide transhydrogenase n=1 Tax=Rubellicoccus peritrichatus TaxID=3080537 RepID=A0AAQ3L8W7_9BACT|nr:Si-specific NAD(P)(+) transhydrogenase [Puniceicoccus sp. CR14]WOO41256.1 Si-specific NAD(P)(+) transhydrogenase [Puniceicoccus sp. CR14]
MKDQYDLIVIGSGPAGEKAAVKAAYHGYSVAVVEKNTRFGGAGTNTGTLPSKTLKETALYYSGFYEKGLFGVDKELERSANAQDFFFRKNQVVDSQEEGIEKNFRLHGIDTFHGAGKLLGPNKAGITGKDNCELNGKFILVATGSYPFQPEGIPFDGCYVHDSDTILQINRIPKSIVIVGAGVIGCEYATIFSVMGSNVKLVNSREEILTFLDREICHALQDQMKEDGVDFIFGNRVEDVAILPEEHEHNVHAKLTNGEPLQADMFLYAAGRSGCSAGLGLEEVGVELGKRGTIVVDQSYRTAVPSVFAVGDIIGFPSLASTGMDQGRVAVTHMFGLHEIEKISEHFPYGIYTIPEVSVFGITEDEAIEQEIPHVIGRAKYTDMPRGKIMGVDEGLLKIIVEKHTRTILGVHIFGKIATELIHYGMSLVENRETLSDVISRVYNTPTLHELYKYAAYNALIEGHYLDKPTGH